MLPFTESRDAPAEIHVDLGGTITPAQNSKYQKQGTTTTADDDNGGAFDRASWQSSATSLLLPFAAGSSDKASAARQWLSSRRQTMQPWREFFTTTKMRVPTTPLMAGARVVRNVERFQTNYALVFVVLLVYCVLTSPVLLLALGACFGLLYLVRSRAQQGQLQIAGRTLPPAYQYALVALLSFPLFYMAGAGSVIFWVIGASIVAILLHALLYASEPQPGQEFETDIETV